MTGHCAVATEALYHLLGGKRAGYVPVSIRHHGEVHWWLRTPTGEVIDLTASQFDDRVPYERGRGRGFQTPGGVPSKRARVVMERALERL